MSMLFRFRLPDTEEDSELGQLHDWLIRDRDLRTSAEVSLLAAPPEPDGMGLSLDAVELILNTSLQLGSLAVAIVSWRKATEPRSAMTITRGDVEVRLSTTDLESMRTVLDALENLDGRANGEEPRDADDASGGPDDAGEISGSRDGVQ